MAIETPKVRIVRDPKNRSRWAYEALAPDGYTAEAVVGNFKGPIAARRAFDLARRRPTPAQQEGQK